MSVYVDLAENRLHRMVMCHMIADTPEELHRMAAAIGMRREWYQWEASFPHYDVAKGRREKAISRGAIPCNRNDFVAHLRRIRASGVFVKGPDGRWQP